MKSSVLFFTTAVTALAMAQPPDTLWTRTYGGSDADRGYSVRQTDDGGYITTGYTMSMGAGSQDVYLVKTNPNGDSLWTRTFGGSSDDYGYSVKQTNDGGYIIAGYTTSYGAGSGDFWLIKTDSQGDSLWTRTFGGEFLEESFSVQQTNDGGYIITGFTYSYGAGAADVCLIKTDSEGYMIWTRTFGGTGGQYGNSVQQTEDGGYVIAGNTSTGNGDVWLIKTNSQGDSLWTRSFGGSSGDEDSKSVQQTTDGGYIIAGCTWSYGAGGHDVWLIKTDSLGQRQWAHTFGGSNNDYGYSVQQTTDGGYVIAGGAGNSDVWLIKTDPLGILQWDRTFGGSNFDQGRSVQQTTDGGYIIAGYTDSYGAGSYDIWLIRLEGERPELSLSPDSLNFSAEVGGVNPAGQNFQIENIGASTFDYTLSEDIPWLTATPMSGGPIPPTDTVLVSVDISGLSAGDYEGEIIVTAAGATGSPDTVRVILHIEASGTQPLRGHEVPKEFALLPAFPNPFNPVTNLTFNVPTAGQVRLLVYDLQGRKVSELYSGWCSAGIYRTTFDGSDFSSGIYFCQMVAGAFVQVRKLLLVK